MTAFVLRRGSVDDIPFVMGTERLPGYDRLVGRWDENRHRAALEESRYAYFIGLSDEEPVGFVIVRDWDAPDQISLIQRLAVVRPGHGWGTKLVRAVVDAVFLQTATYRLAIGAFPENVRAWRAYEAVGFVREGVLRGNVFMHGEHRDELVLAQLRPDWLARRRAAEDKGASRSALPPGPGNPI